MELKRQEELPATTVEISSQGIENSTSLNGSKSNSTSLHFNQIYTESINSKNNSLTDDTIGSNDKISLIQKWFNFVFISNYDTLR